MNVRENVSNARVLGLKMFESHRTEINKFVMAAHSSEQGEPVYGLRQRNVDRSLTEVSGGTTVIV